MAIPSSSKLHAADAPIMKTVTWAARPGCAGEPEQQPELVIEDGARLLAIDRPTPCVRHVERTADLAGAADGDG